MADFKKGMREDRGVFPLSELSRRSAMDFGDSPAMRAWEGEGYKELTYNELHKKVTAIARWLIYEGVKPNDHVAVFGDNSPQWEISYLAIQAAGAICIPVDRMLPSSGARHVLVDSGARMLFSSTTYLEMIAEVENISTLEKTINFEKVDVEDCLFFDDLLEEGAKLDHDLPQREMEDIAAILYTSGTTGHSKGVMLSHFNIMSDVSAAYQLIEVGTSDVFLSVLPVHHSFEATAGFLFPLYSGASITFARSLKSNDIISGIRDTGVTLMVGVPLLYEKMHQGIVRGIRKKGKEKLVNSLMGVVAVGEKLGANLGTKLFRSLREKAGFGTVKLFVSGGGPLDPEVGEFFTRLGMPLLQGYGLTETSPATHMSLPWKVDHKSVGPPLPGVECKLIDKNDQGIGEIVVRGPVVFQGYYKNDEATKETFTDDGWFKTGDLGLIHKHEFLQITGRKKAMLVTAGGKNVYPEEIEFYLNRSPFIAESVVLGVERDKGMGDEVAALIHPDYEQLDVHFEEKGKKATDEDIHALIKSEIQKAQKNLSDYKRIKTFRIFQDEFQKTTKRTIKRFLYSSDMVKVNGEKV